MVTSILVIELKELFEDLVVIINIIIIVINNSNNIFKPVND